MTIEKLSEEKILISLCEEDMESFRLDTRKMGFGDEVSKRSLLRLLQVALREVGMSAVSKTVLMEALPVRSGCLFLLTFSDKEDKRIYKVKKSEGPCFCFENVEKMLSAAEVIYRKEIADCDNTLWLYGSKYYLTFTAPVIKGAVRDVLEKYAKKIPPSLLVSRIKEGGRLLCKDGALYIVGKEMCK